MITRRLKFILVITVVFVGIFAKESFCAKEPEDEKVRIFVFSDQSVEAWRKLQIAYFEGGTWKASKCRVLVSFFGDRRLRTNRQMTSPYLFKGADGLYHCIWAFGTGRNEFAHSSTPNFVDWRKQDNAILEESVIFRNPVVRSSENSAYNIYFKSENDTYYQISTRDFKNYTSPKKISKSDYPDEYSELEVEGKKHTGVFMDMDKADFDKFMAIERDWLKKAEIMAQTPEKLEKRLKNKITGNLVSEKTKKSINPKMIGIFYEDILRAADGGLYPELLQNRDFEYSELDNPDFSPLTAWKISGSAKYSIKTDAPLTKNNPHYLQIDAGNGSSLIVENEGWNGISLKAGKTYDFSLFVKSDAPVSIKVGVEAPGGKIESEETINADSRTWEKYSVPLFAKNGVKGASLKVEISGNGKISLDMFSLYPRDTFMWRQNGLRKDIARHLAALRPNFVRFPGGCLVHSDSPKNFYRWQYTIGKLEDRKPLPNVWKSHQTFGLGYDEYFQFCEDIGAEPLPVVSAGTSCQVKGGAAIPMKDMPKYVQEVLDLIEWANGDQETTLWGKTRAEGGHPKPYNLKYLGIGNEDEPTAEFKKRYLMIKDAVNKKYPDIVVIGSSGILGWGQDFTEGYKLVRDSCTPIIDEHYYESPEWYIAHCDFYDNRDRNGPQIYLGEYGFISKKGNNVYTALCSALYIMSLERNGDIVKMVSYAPLMANKNLKGANRVMIQFDNDGVYPMPEYYVQKLFLHNSGDEYVNSKLQINNPETGVAERIGASIVNRGEETILKIVNILPVETELEIDVGNIVTSKRRVLKTVLSCKRYDDLRSDIRESKTELSGKFKEKLPPYSLTILRFLKD